MILVNTVSNEIFSLNGVEYAKIYQPLTKGLTAIGIFNVYDIKQFLINSAEYDEYSVDTVVYGSQELTIAALIPVIYLAHEGGGGGGVGVFNETPSGLVNGSNVTFVIASFPVIGSVSVYLNGVRQILTTHYSIATKTITFVTAPYSGDFIRVDYQLLS